MASKQQSKTVEPKVEPGILAVEETTTEELSSEDNVEESKPLFVMYTGRANRRIITEKNFADLGVQSRTLEWNEGNEHMLRLDLLTDEVVEAILSQGEFQTV